MRPSRASSVRHLFACPTWMSPLAGIASVPRRQHIKGESLWRSSSDRGLSQRRRSRRVPSEVRLSPCPRQRGASRRAPDSGHRGGSLTMSGGDAIGGPWAARLSRPDRVFPTLTPAQIDRIAPHGKRRAIAPGEVLVDVGQQPVPFFVVLAGEIEVLRPSAATEALIITQGAGQFTGEGTMLTGRRALTRIRAIAPGEMIELGREQLL